MRKRWLYNMRHLVSTLGDFSNLTPICIEEVAPGDTWSGTINGLIRLSPLNRAILQEMYVDYYVFYVPHRLVWANWEDFIAEGPVDSPTYQIPYYDLGASTNSSQSIFYNSNGVSSTRYSIMRIYAFNLIWNEFFRDVNQTARNPTDAPGQYGVPINAKRDYWSELNDTLGFDQDEQFFDTNVGSGTQASAQDVLDAIARQKIQLKRATYGSRYIDILRSYGINVNYQMLQRPEVVAIGRSKVGVTDVVASDAANLGELAGHGISYGKVRLKRKSFPEHGTLMGFCVLRGSACSKNRNTWFDRQRDYSSYFDPGLVTLPHVAVQQQDVSPSADAAQRTNVVGYQPWGEWYRKPLNRVHATLEVPTAWVGTSNTPLSSAATADDYRSPPGMTPLFSDTTYRQWQGLFTNNLKALRLIPKHNISTTSQVNTLG